MSAILEGPKQPASSGGFLPLMKLPLQILAVGLSVIFLFWLISQLHLPGLAPLATALSGENTLATVIALLTFLVGLTFAGFLWWVVERYFALIASKSLSADAMATLKDLPLGLPEGTVRSVLALIVAVIGLPLIVFSEKMGLPSPVSGYLNGIITGVFGFYFGTRSGTVTSQAMSQITDATSRANQAEGERDDAVAAADDAKTAAAASQAQADSATRAAGYDSTVSKLNREMSVASTVLDVIAPALPAGILPAGLATAVSTAKSALDAVQNVTKDSASADQQQLLQSALGVVMGGGSSASLSALIKTAGPMLARLAIPGMAPATAIAALLSVGVKLGSAEYARWRTRVLAAPLAHGLVEFGTVTPDDAHAALLDAPIFAKAFHEERERPGFDADLADTVLRDDALERLWQRYGTGGSGGTPLFTDRAQLEAGLTEFNQVLLAARAGNDMPDGLPATVTATLAKANDPAIRQAGGSGLTRDTLNQIVNAVSKASAPTSGVPTNARAAFDALMVLTGRSRHSGIDLVGALAAIPP